MAPEPSFKTELVATHTPELFDRAVAAAAAVLRRGGLVALPTETVYGLACNALNPDAVAEIFRVKGRPSNNPIIVHVSDVEMARQCVAEWPVVADRLASAFWPGPLTLVLRRSGIIPDIVTAGGRTIGIRQPAHPIIQAVIRACGFPLAAPSANLSTRLSPTNARHVFDQLGGRIPLVLDGGQCNVGIESTVLDISAQPARILRPGMIHEPALLPITGRLGQGPAGAEPLRSPGMLSKHYSPKAGLVVRSWRDDHDLLQLAASLGQPSNTVAVLAHTIVPGAASFRRVSILPKDAGAYARGLYLELHECDTCGANLIIVETPPEGPKWQAAHDRLARAAHVAT